MKEMSLEEKVQRTLDYIAVQNVASMHEYYHSALMHKDEYENIWSKKRDDLSWTNNGQKMNGRAAFRKFYVEDLGKQKAVWLEAARKTTPTLEQKPENYGAGMLWVHTLTTPVIEIAGDGKTAKGVWMSWGHVTNPTPTGFSAMWAYEKYGMDFVKEDGEWKIWHLHTFVDFYSPVEGIWTKPVKMEMPSGDQKPPPDPGVEEGVYYVGYTPATVPVMQPKPPVPYYTFSETFSY